MLGITDNDNPAIIACRALGYDTGSLYTYGSDASLPSLPIVTGYRKCFPRDQNIPEDPATNPLPATVFGCETHVAGDTTLITGNVLDGNTWHANGHDGTDGTPAGPTDFDCVECTATGDVNVNHNPNSIDSPPAGSGRGSDCTHAIDQGAMCYNEGTHGETKCHVHTAAGMDTTTCDDWHGCDGGCIKCSGCAFGCASTDANLAQDIMFGCVQFASTHCVHDATGMADPSFAAALRIFTECAMMDPQPAGYCMGSLASAAYLSNQDVCMGSNADGSGASNSDSTYTKATCRFVGPVGRLLTDCLSLQLVSTSVSRSGATHRGFSTSATTPISAPVRSSVSMARSTRQATSGGICSSRASR